jgi:hypothetical protein
VRALVEIKQGVLVAEYKGRLYSERAAAKEEQNRLKESGKEYEDPFYGLFFSHKKKKYV